MAIPEEPVVVTPAAAPVEPSAPVVAPAVEAAPVEPTAPAADIAAPSEPAAPVEPTAPAAEPSLLESFDADKDPNAPPAVVEPAAPFEYTYALPEVITMDDAQRGEVHKVFDQFRENPKEGAQALLDLHAKTMQDYATHLQNEQVRAWNETRKEWQTQVKADEQLGGAGFQTTMGAIARMRDKFVPESQLPAFNDFLKVTGAGDHPAFLRMLHNVARAFDEPPMPPSGIKPPPTNGQPPKRGVGALYTHPTSQKG